MKHIKKWTRGAPFLFDIAIAVRAGHQTIEALAEKFPRVKKDTVNSACRQLSDDGYLYVRTVGRIGGGRINVYSVRVMPPEPQPEPVVQRVPTVTELDRAWPMRVTLPQARVRYVKRPVGPI